MYTALEKMAILCMTIFGYKIARTVLPWFYCNFLGPMLKPKIRFKDMGKWAVVTGATDGLGKAYAMALAKEGMDIVLISRTLEKLERVAKEIGKKCFIENTAKVQTKIIQADFTQGPEIFEAIEKQLTGLEIGVLVNNVGMSYPHPEYFLDVKDGAKLFNQIVRCNISSVTCMCHRVMPGMTDRARGVIINISSTAGIIPSPMLAVYSASKAYIEKFSEDLSSEYSERGIIIQCVNPGPVVTNMSKIKKSAWMAPDPEKFVTSAMRTVGVTRNTTGYYPHSFLIATVRAMQEICPQFAVWMIRNTMKNIRKRALRKIDQETQKVVTQS